MKDNEGCDGKEMCGATTSCRYYIYYLRMNMIESVRIISYNIWGCLACECGKL